MDTRFGNTDARGLYMDVTEDEIKVRMAAVDEDIWPLPSPLGNQPFDVNDRRVAFSEFIIDGKVVHTDVLEEIYAGIKEMYGTNIPVPR